MFYHNYMRKKNSIIDLTLREKEVLELIIKGYSNPQIASELFVSIHTVKAHLESIYNKFNVHSKVEATVYAIINKIVDINNIS